MWLVSAVQTCPLRPGLAGDLLAVRQAPLLLSVTDIADCAVDFIEGLFNTQEVSPLFPSPSLPVDNVLLVVVS